MALTRRVLEGSKQLQFESTFFLVTSKPSFDPGLCSGPVSGAGGGDRVRDDGGGQGEDGGGAGGQGQPRHQGGGQGHRPARTQGLHR